MLIYDLLKYFYRDTGALPLHDNRVEHFKVETKSAICLYKDQVYLDRVCEIRKGIFKRRLRKDTISCINIWIFVSHIQS